MLAASLDDLGVSIPLSSTGMWNLSAWLVTILGDVTENVVDYRVFCGLRAGEEIMRCKVLTYAGCNS